MTGECRKKGDLARAFKLFVYVVGYILSVCSSCKDKTDKTNPKHTETEKNPKKSPGSSEESKNINQPGDRGSSYNSSKNYPSEVLDGKSPELEEELRKFSPEQQECLRTISKNKSLFELVVKHAGPEHHFDNKYFDELKTASAKIDSLAEMKEHLVKIGLGSTYFEIFNRIFDDGPSRLLKLMQRLVKRGRPIITAEFEALVGLIERTRPPCYEPLLENLLGAKYGVEQLGLLSRFENGHILNYILGLDPVTNSISKIETLPPYMALFRLRGIRGYGVLVDPRLLKQKVDQVIREDYSVSRDLVKTAYDYQ